MSVSIMTPSDQAIGLVARFIGLCLPFAIYTTPARGNGYVGPNAAKDMKWMAKLFSDLEHLCRNFCVTFSI